jgi:regulator of protease activity HflC (stomatin/prohibitin superfamily)
MVKVDLRTTTFNVPPQEVDFLFNKYIFDFQCFLKVLTRDSVTVSVDAVVYSRIINPV